MLQLTEKLGNVSKTCRMHKVSRSQFYEYKRSFQEFGLEDLIDKPPIPGPLSVKKCIIQLQRFRRIWTSGCMNITIKGPTGVTATRDVGPLKRLKWGC
ncbi:helix-turn-helix domain-containing protein [Desulfocastanea catecholica]